MYSRFAVTKLLLPLLLLGFSFSESSGAAPEDTYRQWITEMKSAPRGPFRRLRWYCEDGTILPPEPYACVPHGGGVQHGEWTTKVQQMRANGLYVANILAGGRGATLPLKLGQRSELTQMLLEHFLIQHDAGWIYQRARTYRGGIQVEDESAASQTLLYRLTQLPSLPNQDFLLLRQAYQLLPGRQDTPQASIVRQLSTTLAERDGDFEPLRAKIHSQPMVSDAEDVRTYAAQLPEGRRDQYVELADAIDRLFADPQVDVGLRELAKVVRTKALKQELLDAAALFKLDTHVDTRFLTAGSLLASMRQYFPSETNSQVRLDMLGTGLVLEREMLRSGNKLLKYQSMVSRKSQLGWLSGSNDALYGSGLISARQWLSVSRAIDELQNGNPDIAMYRDKLAYLGRVPGWGSRWLDFHFSQAIRAYRKIEPKTDNFVPDRLRGSSMLIFNRILDGLSRDGNRLAGIKFSVFGEPLGSGLRPLNAGIARGRLYLSPPANQQYDPRGIYVLPETTASLPPIAGILTLGEGNALSHVQLLASNLGIPNVVVNQNVIDRLRSSEGQIVVVAISPGGAVEISRDSSRWDSVLPKNASRLLESRLAPDYGKLDLLKKDFLSLARVRAEDSGKVCGPKAAKLGELKHHFPSAVTDGLVVPFGRFHEFLQKPMANTGMTAYEWLRRSYAQLATLPEPQRRQQTKQVLAQIRNWIQSTDPGEGFRNQLAMALQREFGANGQYTLFIRSDTNVEDLPGFNGAGLNLTVPNVKGFSQIVEAILNVWASPFEERAFAWRQQRMDRPEWVFPSVLLMRSVPVEKSGVLLTQDPQTGQKDRITIAVNAGIGGAVAGESAEELRIDRETGRVTVLSDSTATTFRVLRASGGLVNVMRPADGDVLEVSEIQTLVHLVAEVEGKMPQTDEQGGPSAADIEFGFVKGELALFQIRPFLSNKTAKKQAYLVEMDAPARSTQGRLDLKSPPVM